MSGIPMTSTTKQTYERQSLTANQDFECLNEADADDLVALNMAKRKQPKAKPQPAQPAVPKITEPSPPQVITRDIDSSEKQAEQQAPAGEPAEDGDEAPTGGVPDVGQQGQQARDKYNRRDMRAKR